MPDIFTEIFSEYTVVPEAIDHNKLPVDGWHLLHLIAQGYSTLAAFTKESQLPYELAKELLTRGVELGLLERKNPEFLTFDDAFSEADPDVPESELEATTPEPPVNGQIELNDFDQEENIEISLD